jgi:hypothetical protein
LKNLSNFENGYEGPKRFSRVKILAYAEKRLAPALCGAIGNGCVNAIAGALGAILLSAGINKIIRVTTVTLFYCSELRTLKNFSSFALRWSIDKGKQQEEGAVS